MYLSVPPHVAPAYVESRLRRQSRPLSVIIKMLSSSAAAWAVQVCTQATKGCPGLYTGHQGLSRSVHRPPRAVQVCTRASKGLQAVLFKGLRVLVQYTILFWLGCKAGEDARTVAQPVPECSQEQAVPGGAVLPGQHGGCAVCTSSQVCSTPLAVTCFLPCAVWVLVAV